MVWLIPLITVIVGGWLVVKTLSEQGPKASISFKTAEGIEVGKTKIKYKNVSIGMVEQIRFSDDLSHVLISGEFDKGTDHFLRRNTRFWVVKPQFGLKGVSGLSTLISGAYIEIEPGPGAPQSHFVGLEKAPVVTANEAGKRISLISGRLGSIDTGSPIYYQGMEAGEVLDGEGGYTVYGTLMGAAKSCHNGYLPMGLASGVTLKTHIANGQLIKFSDVEIDETSMAFQFRRQMEATFDPVGGLI